MRTEKILALAFLVVIILKILHLPGASVILVVLLSGISCFYFAGAFYFFCDKIFTTQNYALSIVSGIFFSIIPIGILFKVQYWFGANINLLIGAIPSAVLLILTIFLKSKSSEKLKNYYKNMIIRTSILTFLAFLFYFTTSLTLLKIQHWDDPELARLKNQCYSNYENTEYQKQLNDYLLKRDSLQFEESKENK